MGNLNTALQELRAERKQAQSHVEKLDQAISVIESFKRFGNNSHDKTTDPNNISGVTAQNGAGPKS
jgi:hypothetical protein